MPLEDLEEVNSPRVEMEFQMRSKLSLEAPTPMEQIVESPSMAQEGSALASPAADKENTAVRAVSGAAATGTVASAAVPAPSSSAEPFPSKISGLFNGVLDFLRTAVTILTDPKGDDIGPQQSQTQRACHPHVCFPAVHLFREIVMQVPCMGIVDPCVCGPVVVWSSCFSNVTPLRLLSHILMPAAAPPTTERKRKRPPKEVSRKMLAQSPLAKSEGPLLTPCRGKLVEKMELDTMASVDAPAAEETVFSAATVSPPAPEPAERPERAAVDPEVGSARCCAGIFAEVSHCSSERRVGGTGSAA